jgi:probable HAF family extracellular repeat protein
MSIFTFTPLDDPQASGGAFVGTLAYGINASGQVVGYYNNSTGGGTHGFLLSAGT